MKNDEQGKVAHYSHAILGVKGPDRWLFVNNHGKPTEDPHEAKRFTAIDAIDAVLADSYTLPGRYRHVAVTVYTDGTTSLDSSAGRPHLPRCRTPFCPICMGEPIEPGEDESSGAAQP